jgi:hypothetical protein
MSKLVEAFGKGFAENKDALRIRSFQMGGHTFKVKIPLTSEYDVMVERLKTPDEVKVAEYYSELTKHFIENKDKFTEDLGIIFKEDDVEIQGRSMKEAAKNKALTELRILEMFKLLVPAEGYSLQDLTYAEIEELFPFSIQIELIEKISETISPGYKEIRGK